MRRTWLAVLCLSIGCASTPPKTPSLDQSALDAADANVLRGCYDCLIDAHAAYQRAAVGQRRSLVVERLFETDLLIALREREFDLPSSGAVERARALAAELPAAVEAGRFLDLVARVPPEHGSWDRKAVQAFRAANQYAPTAGILDDLVWLSTGILAEPVRRYLGMTLFCAYPSARLQPGPAQTMVLPGENPSPLVRYRSQACSGRNDKEIASLLSDVPDFVEAKYFAGINAVGAIPVGGGPDPRPLIAAVAARFPDAIAVTYLSARLQQSIGNCTSAMPLFDRVIVARPEHEDAWLGRAMCLTDLSKRDEAIDVATHIIDAKMDTAMEALYWRAFNRHQLGQLPQARADIGTVRAGHVTPEILQLAGIIEHDQDDLAPAEKDLKWVVDRSSGYCTAQWYLGSVYVKQEIWKQAATVFETASTCYATDADNRTFLVAKVRANNDLDAEYKAAQVAELERQIATSRHQQHAAALNAAKFFAAIGDLEHARSMFALAQGDAEITAELDEFGAWLERAVRAASRP